jgi:isopenicillin N synthase-like dioxygenase
VSFEQIPVLSLAEWRSGDGDPDAAANRAAFAEQLCTTCHEVGFLRLVDHGVDPDFLDAYFDALEAFFALPGAVKARIDKSNSPWFRGWERVGAELTDARTDHREQIDVWTDLPPRRHDGTDPTGPSYLRLEGPNQWPDDDLLPGFRALVERFQAEMGAIATELLAAFETGLGLSPGALADAFGADGMSLVKLIHYPPTPPGEAGVNAHHDTGFLTLLWQHGVGGLQVQNQDGGWIDVPADDDAIVVNIGEMLQSMTGNYFVATNHRVITSDERCSSAYFHGPRLDTPLVPLDLDERFTTAVAASPHHRDAGFMARRDELLVGARGTTSAPAATYGEQLWNYFTRSYPDLVARHHPDRVGDSL